MSPLLLTLIFAVAAVALFVLGLSITLIVKGRNIQSEVGENDEMKKRGIKCTMQQIREDEAKLAGDSPLFPAGCDDGSCGSCGTTSCADKK